MSKTDKFLSKQSVQASNDFKRVMGCATSQFFYFAECDTSSENIRGKTILITGGGVGIGYETAKDLYLKGGLVVIASRTESNLIEAVKKINNEVSPEKGSISYLILDLSDLSAVASFTQLYASKYGPIDILIENAGLWPKKYSVSPQGYEASFATNTLGHHLLRRRLHNMSLLKPDARIITVTGDINALANEASVDFKYEGEGQMAYCRSKLAINWLFNEFRQRYPNYNMYLVHPGVVATDLVMGTTGISPQNYSSP